MTRNEAIEKAALFLFTLINPRAVYPKGAQLDEYRLLATRLMADAGARFDGDPGPVRDALVEACRKAKRALEEESADTDGLTDLGMDAHAALADAILLVERGPALAAQKR